ncbi:sorting nexin-21 [Anthonomus grandis grandis]|uniref:sorting nexin-21 n=1 Tax=Anthonomus grandis grandis TaxID=2921223 RepID=UPI00216693F1|nr:sorting nexin-21 [Anthonomus grandis grandis]
MTQILDSNMQGLVLEVISANISDEVPDKKYVLYTLQIRYISGNDDLTPSVIQRRYTQFQNLYNSLYKEFPAKLGDISFPKKAYTGNFSNELIMERSTAFEQFLKHIASDSQLRTSKAMHLFLQEPELTDAKQQIEVKLYDVASQKLENIFRLLNKVFSDRSHEVLLILCRLVACSAESDTPDPARLKWANLALYRFNGVSDSDLLELYMPLLHSCVKIYNSNNQSAEELTSQLQKLQRKGMRDVEGRTLLIAIQELEEKMRH